MPNRPWAPIPAEGDQASIAAIYSRHLRVANLSHATHRAYLPVVGPLGRFLTQHGMPTNVAVIRRELIEAFIDDQLARLRPASGGQSVREGA